MVEDRTIGSLPGQGAVKILLNIALLVGECLPRGVELRVMIDPDMNVEISAAGEGPRIDAHLRTALSGPLGSEDLDPKTAHGYFTHLAAERMGVTIELDAAEDLVRLTVRRKRGRQVIVDLGYMLKPGGA